MHRHTRTPSALAIHLRAPLLERAAGKRFRFVGAVARRLAVLLIGISALSAAPIQALTLCANSPTSLQAAISVARFAQEAVTIRIASGTYAVPGLSVGFSSPTTLLGGYDAGCTIRPVNLKASDTVLDFGGYGVNIWQQLGSPVSVFSIYGLSLLNAANLRIEVGGYGHEGNIFLSRTRITGVPSSAEPAALVVYDGGTLRLDDVLVDTLPAAMPSGQCALALELVEGATLSMQSTTIALPANRNLCLQKYQDDSTAANLYNSIIWSTNQTSAIDSDLDTVDTFNSTFFSLSRHGGNGQDAAVLHTDPQWMQPGSADYRLASTSTSVNSGTPITPTGLSEFDIDGQPRWQGVLPDRGAYESAYQSAATYTVTTTSDSGAGSLRDAMNKANENPNLGVIKFAIPGACPRVIALDTVLPKVTTPMFIDGTSQPGWLANTDADAFLATVCVAVMPASGTLVTAFNVPATADVDASLTLRGVAMGGFQQPVFLAGGSGHVIAGNRFGGFLSSGVDLAGATGNSINVTPTLGNGSFIIGGAALADRNLISKSAFAGIKVQAGVDGSQSHCQIVNNLIGTSASGNVAAPNFTGITMAGSHCLIDANRIVGNSTDGIVLDNAYDTHIQRNIIGLTVDGNGLQNSGVGIRFTAVPADTVVGAPLSTYEWGLRNTIRFMAQAGIQMLNGTGNTIRSNEIRDNGIGGDGLDIDLGSDGPTANDADVADAPFANHGQNFPIVTGVAIPAGTPTSATNVSATLTVKLDSVPNLTYRIDAYFTNHCSGVHARGHADAYLGGTTAANLQVVNFNVILPNVLPTGFVSFTATNPQGNTSEMGTCFPVVGSSDTIFKNGFDG